MAEIGQGPPLAQSPNIVLLFVCSSAFEAPARGGVQGMHRTEINAAAEVTPQVVGQAKNQS